MVATSSLAAPVLVQLHAESTVEGKRIELGEVADIRNAPGPLAGFLADLDLGNAPGPGKSQRLKTSHIRMAIQRQQLDVAGVEVVGVPLLTVHGKGTVITGEELLQRVIDRVRENTGWDETDARIRVPRHPNDLHLPPGPVETEITRVSGDDYGLTLYVITAWQDGFEVGRVPISLNIQRAMEVLVAAKPIQLDSMITKDDLEYKRRTVGSAHDESRFLTDPALVVGKRSRRVINSDMPLTLTMIDNPPVIERGDPVQVKLKRNGIDLTMRGKASEAGRIGELIRVSTPNGSTLRGKLHEGGVVLVN